MKNEYVTITFENGTTLKGELISWSKEVSYSNEVVKYNFSVKPE